MKKVGRGKSTYWQRLRKDKPSNIACIIIYLSFIIVTISWINLLVHGTPHEARGNIFYWILMFPAALVVNWLGDLDKRSAALIMPSIILLPIICFGSYVYEVRGDVFDDFNERLICSLIVSFLSILSFIFYRRSMLYHEGPFMGQP